MRRKRRKKRFLLKTIVSLVLAALVYGVVYLASDLIDKQNENTPGNDLTVNTSSTPSIVPTATPEPTPEAPVFQEAVWIGVGDIMSHSPQLPGAYIKAEDRYDFDPFFNEVAPILKQGDWIMANLETPVAGADIGYSGYPTFNAPNELVEALQNAGFNLLTTANNHSLDKGERGILRTLELLQKLGLQYVGTAASQEEAEKLLLVEKNGIVMGILSYTYGTNGIPIPAGKDYLVSLIDETKIKADIHRIREAGADVVTVALHFGTEYQTMPNEEQKRLARSLVAAGADIIAGSHPHVLQPYELVETVDDNGNAKQAVIIYSMGNFISNQRGNSKDYGAIFKVNIRKNMTDKTIEISDVEVTPTWVHRYKPDQHYRYRILPVEETIAASSDKLLKPSDYEMLKKDFDMLVKRLEALK